MFQLEKIFSTARRDRLNRALEGAVKANDAGTNNDSYDLCLGNSSLWFVRCEYCDGILDGLVMVLTGGDEEVVLEDELQKSHVVDTTLLLHFFGRKGKQDLKFEEFKM